MDATITHDAAGLRWEARLGDELAGHLAYERRDGGLALLHTVVEPAHEGQGLAGQLVQAAIEHARSSGTAVLPYCRYVQHWLQRHPEALDVVPPDHRPDQL